MTIPRVKPDPKHIDLGESLLGSPDPSKPRPKRPQEQEERDKEKEKEDKK